MNKHPGPTLRYLLDQKSIHTIDFARSLSVDHDFLIKVLDGHQNVDVGLAVLISGILNDGSLPERWIYPAK